jgi:flagellar hook assembly protein FlgD
VLDVAGRRVRTLESGEAPTGMRKLAWDLRDDQGRRVASGLYFVKVTQGTRSKFTRVVVQ